MQIETVLAVGGFKMKSWILGGSLGKESRDPAKSIIQIKDYNRNFTANAETSSNNQKVLGMNWNSTSDHFQFNIKLFFFLKDFLF